MKICVACKTELHCLKNGVGADFGHEHVYAGDLYSCGICGIEVLFCNTNAYKDYGYKVQDYYINVKDGGVVPVSDSKRKTILTRLKKTWLKN